MKKIKSLILFTIGFIFICTALLYNYNNNLEEKNAYVNSMNVLENLDELIKKEIIDNNNQFETFSLDGNEYIGTIELVDLDIKLPIMSEWSYSKLKIAPCRYRGSEKTNDLIIMAHNYRTHFKNIDQLEIGSIINYQNANGDLYKYQVIENTIIDADDIQGMITAKSDLTLFTCNFSATKRLTVMCELLDVKMANSNG